MPVNEFDAELEQLRAKRRQSLAQKGDSLDVKRWPEGAVEVTSESLDRFVGDYQLAVVDCWAPCCGPCRTVGPIIDALARDYRGKVAFGKLNVDANQSAAQRYGVMSIPTILIFKSGKLVDQSVGASPRDALERRIVRHLGGP